MSSGRKEDCLIVEKIKPDEIGIIIYAEIPDPETKLELYKIVTTNMIHGPSDNYNRIHRA